MLGEPDFKHQLVPTQEAALHTRFSWSQRGLGAAFCLEGVPRCPRCVLADSGLCQLGSSRPGSGPLPLGQRGAKSCPRVCGFVLGVCLGPGRARGLDHLSRASQSWGHITLRTWCVCICSRRVSGMLKAVPVSSHLLNHLVSVS